MLILILSCSQGPTVNLNLNGGNLIVLAGMLYTDKKFVCKNIVSNCMSMHRQVKTQCIVLNAQVYN